MLAHSSYHLMDKKNPNFQNMVLRKDVVVPLRTRFGVLPEAGSHQDESSGLHGVKRHPRSRSPRTGSPRRTVRAPGRARAPDPLGGRAGAGRPAGDTLGDKAVGCGDRRLGTRPGLRAGQRTPDTSAPPAGPFPFPHPAPEAARFTAGARRAPRLP